MWKLTEEELQALIDQFQRSEWRELRLRMKGFELLVAKDGSFSYRELSADEVGTEPTLTPHSPESISVSPPHSRAAQVELPAGWLHVRAPSLGSFYRAPKPGAPPFVDIGSRVIPETEVCLIEVMKLFTTVRAGVAGTIRQIYSSDAELVEFDQPLFLVEPDV
jgi:acetyl-CoA carboxylase biotin carboxyl carrier protein